VWISPGLLNRGTDDKLCFRFLPKDLNRGLPASGPESGLRPSGDDTDGDLKIPIPQFEQIPKFQSSQNFLKRLNPRICLRQGYSEGIRDQAA
jgi:hypothetical protein